MTTRVSKSRVEELAREVGASLEVKGSHVYITRPGKEPVHARGWSGAYSKLYYIKRTSDR